MHYKIIIIVLCLTCCVYGQKTSEKQFLETPDDRWISEVIHFPFGFAPDLNYEGYEALQFSKEWSNQSSQEFWSYVIAWHIALEQPFTLTETSNNLKVYYDGLMKAVNKDKSFTVPETTVEISPKGRHQYQGRITIYDSFHSLQTMTLYVQISHVYCEKKNNYTPLFFLSSQQHDHSVWQRLKKVRVVEDYCEF
ncbi:MAG: hypothetical protein GYB32_07105 [Algicola sp.]|nr:hypothetical protein [Algicola sp.]